MGKKIPLKTSNEIKGREKWKTSTWSSFAETEQKQYSVVLSILLTPLEEPLNSSQQPPWKTIKIDHSIFITIFRFPILPETELKQRKPCTKGFCFFEHNNNLKFIHILKLLFHNFSCELKQICIWFFFLSIFLLRGNILLLNRVWTSE